MQCLDDDDVGQHSPVVEELALGRIRNRESFLGSLTRCERSRSSATWNCWRSWTLTGYGGAV